MLRVDQKNNNKPIKTRKRKRSKKKTEAPIQQDLTSENAKREMIEALLLKTDINECDLNVIYDEFYEMYPCGEIDEQQFLKISKVNSRYKLEIIIIQPIIFLYYTLSLIFEKIERNSEKMYIFQLILIKVLRSIYIFLFKEFFSHNVQNLIFLF